MDEQSGESKEEEVIGEGIGCCLVTKIIFNHSSLLTKQP